jgi:hypothetical protein
MNPTAGFLRTIVASIIVFVTDTADREAGEAVRVAVNRALEPPLAAVPLVRSGGDIFFMLGGDDERRWLELRPAHDRRMKRAARLPK